MGMPAARTYKKALHYSGVVLGTAGTAVP